MPIIQVTIAPLGNGASVSRYVAKTHEILLESGLNHMLTPMATIIEGDDLTELMQVVQKMHESLFEMEDVLRVSTSIKIDDRRDKKSTMLSKIKSVEEKLTP